MDEIAVLAGGCFWGMQELFRHLPGVVTTTIGYCGSTTAHPTYNQIASGTTGHAETIKITYNSAIVTFKEIIGFFFQIHNATTIHQQGNDYGSQYRSVIFYQDDVQYRQARNLINDLNQSGKLPGKIVTELVPYAQFFQAESEHQDFLQNNPNGYSCHWIRDDWKIDNSN